MKKLYNGSSSVGLVLLLFITLSLAYTLAGGFDPPSLTSDKPSNTGPANSALATQGQQVQVSLQTVLNSVNSLQTEMQAMQNEIQAQSTLPVASRNFTQLLALHQQLAQTIASIQPQYQSLQTQTAALGSPPVQTAVQSLGQAITNAVTQDQAVQSDLTLLQTAPDSLTSAKTDSDIQGLDQNINAIQTTYDSVQTQVNTVVQSATGNTSTTAQKGSNQIIVTQSVPDSKNNLQLRTFTIITVAPTSPPVITGLVSCNTNNNIPSLEHGVFKTFAPSLAVPGDSIKVWFADENTPQVGVSEITVDVPGGSSVTKTFPVSPLTGVPSVAINPQVGAGYSDPDPKWRGTDVYGIPIYPSMFITDITTDPNSTAGDWENGGKTALPPHALFGTWTSTTKHVDSAGKVTLSVGPPAPSKNHWDLGAGSDPVPPYTPSGKDDTAYGAEAKWDVNTLVSQGYMQAGHTYRVEFIVHDGDATKAGGDVDERCGTVRIP